MKILYKKTNFKKVGFSTMAFTAKILSWRFRHLNIVGCLLKRRPTKGGSREPQDPPPPSYAPATVMSLAMFTHIPCHLYSRNESQWDNAEDVARRRCGNLLIKTSAWQRRRCLLRAKRHNQGVMLMDSEVAIPWKDEDAPLCSNRNTAEDRLISCETPSAKAGGCWEILPGHG